MIWTGLYIAWGVLCVIALAAPEAKSVPVVPNFSQGVVTSHTETKTVVKESIRSESYRTGFEYSVSGTGVEPSGGGVSPSAGTKSLNLSSRSTWVQTTPGAAFQFAETYSGPGLIEKVMIDRETVIESVTDSTSTFSQ
jgi:hypothetical protein|tara:strand:+ start:725 stop:1138 length:414 start_codon:yes stop_codon:yes gene_type:complete